MFCLHVLITWIFLFAFVSNYTFSNVQYNDKKSLWRLFVDSWVLGLLNGTRGKYVDQSHDNFAFSLLTSAVFQCPVKLGGKKLIRYRGSTAVVTNNKLLSWRFKCELLLVVYNVLSKATSIFSAKVTKVVEPLWPSGLFVLRLFFYFFVQKYTWQQYIVFTTLLRYYVKRS